MAGAGLFGLLAGVVHAAPPNDNWVDRVVIGTLPYAQIVPAMEQATNEPTDPELFCVLQGSPMTGSNSVWYEYTTGAAAEYVDIEADGYDTLAGVFAGSPKQGYSMVRGGCNDDDWSDSGFYGSKIFGLRLDANTRYSIEVATYTPRVDPPMQLTFSVRRSAVYHVTKTADTEDGVCDADCSLREAVNAARTVSGAVVVPAGRYIVSSALQASNGGSIYGAGMDRTVIDANGVARVLVHSPSDRNTFALHDLTLTGGLSTGAGGAFLGASSGYYALDRVALRASKGLNGGGVAVSAAPASVSMFDSVVSGNTATGNTANGKGGGLYFSGSNIELVGTSIVDNDGFTGGGIYMAPYRAGRLKNTTVSGNAAGGAAAGVYAEAWTVSTRLAINNSSIVDNATSAAASPQNGGLVVTGDDPPTTAPVITNTVLAGNHLAQVPATILDCGKTATITLMTGYDLVQAPNGCGFGATGDVTAVDPQLQPLTATALPVHVQAEGSPLIDAGTPGGGCEATDARGVVRPVDGDANGTPRCDIGAVEWTVSRDGDLIFADGFE